jgi:hypothetical protein
VITSFLVAGPIGFIGTGSFVSLDEFPYPCQKLTWAYPVVGDTVARPFSAGRWDTRKSVEVMTIDVEGEIVTNTTSDYWIARKTLAAFVLPQKIQIPSIYRHSQIRMQIDGDTENYIADVQLTSYAIPLAATGSPTVSPFMFSWECNMAYWIAESTGEAVLL